MEPIREHIAAGRPFLGVCMGLQALLTVSEEGVDQCAAGMAGARCGKANQLAALKAG